MHHLTARPSPRTLEEAIEGVVPDGSIDVEPRQRRPIAQAWIEHAASERAEAISMARVASFVLTRDVPADLQWIATRGASDELRHAAICARLARAYDPAIGPLPPARHFASVRVAVAPEHEGTLHAIVQCCVQETIAAAYLERAHGLATAPVAKAALRGMFSDEIDHGRIGFALAATLAPDVRVALRAPIAALIEVCRELWHARAGALPPAAAPEHGVLAPAQIVEIVEDAVTRLVRPGLRELDLA